MDNWENIKEALKLTGGKYILAEKGEPSYVVVELDEYVGLLKRNESDNEKEIRKLGNWEIKKDEEKHISKNSSNFFREGNNQEGNSQKGNNIEQGNNIELENLSERGLIEKINGNINVWKDLQDKRMLRKMEIENTTIDNAAKGEEEDGFNGGDLNEEKIVIEEI